MLMSPCHFDTYLDPTSVKKRIWGDEVGTSRCDAGSSMVLSGAMLEAYGSLSCPNLMTGSWSDHP
jgi:hypothetical protein